MSTIHHRSGETRVLMFTLAFLFTAQVLSSQLPPSPKLSEEDNREFHAELDRLQGLLPTANDEGTVEFQIAKTDAAGGQYGEAIHWLRRVVEADLGFDPSRDPDFLKIRNTVELQALVAQVRRQTPPVSGSRSVTTIQQPNLFPENLAFDPATNSFFFGNTAKDEIVRCPVKARCVPWVSLPRETQGYVLGLKMDQRSGTVWATNDTADHASLYQYDLHTGQPLRTARIEGKHVFNDLALSSTGTVYVTDTPEGAVYVLESPGNALRKLVPDHTFTAANGIALSPDEKTLYVSAWGDGIDAVDLKTLRVMPVPHPATVCLAYIDGLYAIPGSLIAMQNGPMVPRIMRFTLSPDGQKILGMSTLERRNPLFDGITTGALVNGQLYYVANPQMEKKGGPTRDPLQILALPVLP